MYSTPPRLHVDYITCTVSPVRCISWWEYFKQDGAPPHPTSISLSFSLSLSGPDKTENGTMQHAQRQGERRSDSCERKKERANKTGRWRENTSVHVRSTCSTILPQLSSLHIQHALSPAFYCLPAASINYGWYYVCEREGVRVRSEEISKRRGGGRGGWEGGGKREEEVLLNESTSPQICFSQYFLLILSSLHVVITVLLWV